jgi:hypothetical protein
MRKSEVSVFLVEYLKLDENKLKILDYSESYILEVVDWTTVIDLHMDRFYMKKIL